MSVLRQVLLPPGTAGRRLLLAGSLAAFAAIAGIALLALSGWLITAAGLAGLGMLAMLDIFAPGAGIRAAAMGRTVGRYLERLVGHDATLRQLAGLRRAAAEGLLRRPIRELQALSSGDTLNRLTRDVDVLDHAAIRLLLPALAAILTGAGLTLWAWTLLPALGLWIGAIGIGLSLLLLELTRRTARAPGAEVAAATGSMRVAAADWSTGLAELVSLDRAADFGQRVLDGSRRQLHAQRRQRRIEALVQFVLTAAGYLLFLLVLVLGLTAVQRGTLEAPVSVAIALAVFALAELWLPLVPGVGFYETMRRSAARVDQLLHSPAPATQDGAWTASSGPARIEIRGLHYRHAAHLPELFGGLDLVIEPGQRVLLQGPSGCGKSTLMSLIAGVIEPQRGTILLDGSPVQAWPEDALRARLGWLEQRATLFADTLAANLRLANGDADDAALRQVLEQVGLGPLVAALPDGLQTWVGEFGQQLSGGQVRRVALARVVLGGFDAVLLDEPTAGLDRTTAEAMWRALEPWLAQRSLVICAHDLQGLPPIDRRLVRSPDGRWRELPMA